mmetsp:Transcript_19525/g.41795  ORF Transcript_19525/g.41795 Transcript_19525/m.41795 type:complete len:289 (+) Transcript_19525:930-1796(+)
MDQAFLPLPHEGAAVLLLVRALRSVVVLVVPGIGGRSRAADCGRAEAPAPLRLLELGVPPSQEHEEALRVDQFGVANHPSQEYLQVKPPLLDERLREAGRLLLLRQWRDDRPRTFFVQVFEEPREVRVPTVDGGGVGEERPVRRPPGIADRHFAGGDDVGVGSGRRRVVRHAVHRELALDPLGVLDRVGDGDVCNGLLGVEARRQLRRRGGDVRFPGELGGGRGGDDIRVVFLVTFFRDDNAGGDRGIFRAAHGDRRSNFDGKMKVTRSRQLMLVLQLQCGALSIIII